jgi:hypothetical protein
LGEEGSGQAHRARCAAWVEAGRAVRGSVRPGFILSVDSAQYDCPHLPQEYA